MKYTSTARMPKPIVVVHAAAHMPYSGTSRKLRPTFTPEATSVITGIRRFFLATLAPIQKMKYRL